VINLPENTRQAPAYEAHVNALLYPALVTYDDAQAWLTAMAKAYGSLRKFSATAHYRAMLPKIDALYASEKGIRDSALLTTFVASGLRYGDDVRLNEIGAFLTEVELNGQVVCRTGLPYVKIAPNAYTDKVYVKWSGKWRPAEAKQATRRAEPKTAAPLVFGPWIKSGRYSVKYPDLAAQPGYDFVEDTTLDSVYMALTKKSGTPGVTLSIGSSPFETLREYGFTDDKAAMAAAYDKLAAFCKAMNRSCYEQLDTALDYYKEAQRDGRAEAMRTPTLDRLSDLSVAARNMPEVFTDERLLEKISTEYNRIA
jgi:hypothetical protein